MADQNLTEAAIAFARKDKAVFPLKPRAKTPLTTHGFKDATTDAEQVAAWWTKYPNANIGCATGTESGFWSLDVDGLDGEASLRALEAEHEELPTTVELITGNGRQIFFKYSEPIRCSAGQLDEGLDIRAAGGYTILPPSIHPSGRRYAWSVDGDPSEVRACNAPEWLLSLVRPHADSAAKVTPSEDWRSLVADGTVHGARNQSIARLAGHLLRKYVDPIVVLELARVWNRARCRPPLPDTEVDRIVNSIAGRDLVRRGKLHA